MRPVGEGMLETMKSSSAKKSQEPAEVKGASVSALEKAAQSSKASGIVSKRDTIN
jgi:hypothetical protein